MLNSVLERCLTTQAEPSLFCGLLQRRAAVQFCDGSAPILVPIISQVNYNHLDLKDLSWYVDVTSFFLLRN